MFYFEPEDIKISPGWFKSSHFIRKITIEDVDSNGKIIDIEIGAFNDCTFRRMTELVIFGTKVTALKRGVFEGANSLQRLTLDKNDAMQIIEEHTLDPLYNLEEMNMTRQTQLLDSLNVTGTTQLRQLRALTLSFNSFGSSINADTFKGCTRVEILNLSNSSIETIGIGSFDPMIETIRSIDLSNNQLKHLPADLLTNLIKQSIQIYLSNNLWNCDCDSLALQSWYVSNESLIMDSLICDTPTKEEIKDVDLSICESYSTTLTSDGTTLKTTESTIPSPFLDRLSCVNEKYSSGHLYLERSYQYFNVKQVEMGKVLVEISSLDSTLSMVVINDKQQAECRYDINRQMTFDNLNPNAGHLFCLIKKFSYGTSPWNCYPFHFDDTKSIWGHDEIIIALVCSIVLSFLAGVLCGWLLSRRYQRVFKAKASLQYQSSERSASKAVTEMEDFNSSITSDYNAGRYVLDGGSNSKRLR